MDLTKALDAPTAIVGAVGSGKTFLGKMLVEQLLHDNRRVIIIDPTGVWWGLRAGHDGNAGGGFPVTIFGGDHADVAIDPTKGEVLATAIAAREVQAIIDISDMTGGEKVRFLTAFLTKLYVLNRAALYLVVDEADEVAPQNPMPDERQLSGIFDKIVRRGRVRGFRPLMITQRPAVLHKNVLSQIGTLIAMKLTSPQDRAAIDAWVKGNADNEQAKAVMTSLASLQRGEGWVWSPAAGILERRQFPPIVTFDSSRTPQVDEIVVEPALSPVDVEDLRDEMFVGGQQWTENEVKSAKSAVDIQKLCTEAEERGYDRGIKEGETRGFKAGFVDGVNAARRVIDEMPLDQLGHAALARAVDRTTPVKIVSFEPAVRRPEIKQAQREKTQRATAAMEQVASGFTAPQVKVLRAVGMWAALGKTPTKPMVAMIAGYSHSSGGFGNLLGQLRTAGAIEYPEPGAIRLVADIGKMGPSEAKEAFFGKLTGPQRKVVDALEHAGELTKKALGEATGYSPSSGGFGNILGQLRTLGVIDYPSPGRVAMESWVFDIL